MGWQERGGWVHGTRHLLLPARGRRVPRERQDGASAVSPGCGGRGDRGHLFQLRPMFTLSRRNPPTRCPLSSMKFPRLERVPNATPASAVSPPLVSESFASFSPNEGASTSAVRKCTATPPPA